MKRKKLKLSTLLLLGIGLTGLQAQTMYVRQTSNTQTSFELSNIKKMTFSTDNLTIIKTTGSPDTYALNGLRYLNFKDLSTSIVANDKKDIDILLYPNPVADVQ